MQVQTLGRYRVLKELGRGAMGRVLLAHDPEIDRRVAVKTIQIFSSLPEGERAQARERFLREARSTGKLLHPGIVTIFDVGEDDGVPYLAMEYVEGVTLDAFCRKDTLLPVETVVQIGAKVAEALAFAHAAGIVHRDVKPANLMRAGGTDVKIMDFGLAKSAETQLTNDGSLLGTPNYMSPEQIRGDEIDGRSDLFSLAVVVYEMLTGEKPFTGDSISTVLYRIVNEKPADPDRMSPPLRRFLDRALAKAPRDRFATGTEFAAALRRAAWDQAPPPAGAPKPAPRKPVIPPPPPPPAAARRWPYVVGALAIAALLAGAVALKNVVGGAPPAAPPAAPTSFEARVRTEPPNLPVVLDGKPVQAGIVRFPATAPFGTLAASTACRTATHALDASDHGGEVVLVPDPVTAEVMVDPQAAGARVTLNGTEAGAAPASLTLDLCKENRIEVAAPGFRDAAAVVPLGALPADARTVAGGIRLEAIPKGTLVLPRARPGVAFSVDGTSVARGSGSIELTEGTHELRAYDEATFTDVRESFEVKGSEEVQPKLAIPGLATVVIQAFPANCRAYLKKPGGEWRYLDDTPVRRDVAAGRWLVKVEFTPTGEARERQVTLSPGENPPLRFAFGRQGR